MPQLFCSKPTMGNKEQMPDCRFQQSDCLHLIKVISDWTGQLIGFDVSSVKGHQIHSRRPGTLNFTRFVVMSRRRDPPAVGAVHASSARLCGSLRHAVPH